MKKAWIIFALVLSVATAAWVFGLSPVGNGHQQSFIKFAEAKDSDAAEAVKVPYKATTVDECIHEQECVWYAFKRYTGLGDKNRETKLLTRWEEPIKYSITGSDAMDMRRALQGNFKKISQFFPYEIKYVMQPNFLVILTDDMAKVRTVYRDTIIRVFGEKAYERLVQNLFKKTKHRHVYLTSEQGRRFAGLIVIKSSLEKANEDIPYYVFNALGFDASTIGENLNGQHVPNLEDHVGTELNDLHFFLIEVLYHLQLKTGMDFKEVKTSFLGVYPEVLKNYQNRKE